MTSLWGNLIDPPNPTTKTIFCCVDMLSPFVSLVISSSLASSMPIRSVVLVYRDVMRGSIDVLAGVIISTLYLYIKNSAKLNSETNTVRGNNRRIKNQMHLFVQK